MHIYWNGLNREKNNISIQPPSLPLAYILTAICIISTICGMNWCNKYTIYDSIAYKVNICITNSMF